jgi:hypothetical protein
MPVPNVCVRDTKVGKIVGLVVIVEKVVRCGNVVGTMIVLELWLY